MNSPHLILQDQLFEIKPLVAVQYLVWLQGQVFITGTQKFVLQFWRFDTRRIQKSLIQKQQSNVCIESGYHSFTKDTGCSQFENNVLYIVHSRNKIIRKLITWHKSLIIVKSNPTIGVIFRTSRLVIWNPQTGGQLPSRISSKYFLSKIDYKWDCKEIVCMMKDQLSVIEYKSAIIVRSINLIRKDQSLHVRRLEYTPDGKYIVGLIHVTEISQQIFICLWNSSNLKCIWQIEGEFIDVCVSKNSQFIIGNLQSKLNCYSINSGHLIGEFGNSVLPLRQFYQSLEFSPCSQYLVAINNKKLSIFNLQGLALEVQ